MEMRRFVRTISLSYSSSHLPLLCYFDIVNSAFIVSGLPATVDISITSITLIKILKCINSSSD